MQKKLLKLLLFKRTILIFGDFMHKGNFKSDTMKESGLQKLYSYRIYPRDSKIYSDKGFVIIDNGSEGGTHWCSFVVKHENHFASIVLVVNLINFFSIIYLNPNYIILIRFKIKNQDYADFNAYTFSF